jgi:acetyl-CoA acetyltransferase
VILGCANQAGEDNRNVARMASLLAGLPVSVPGTTINRLCGSGLDAIGNAARALRCGEAGLMLAGGVESMSRAPFVMGKSEQAFGRSAELFDTTIGWRFVNPLMKRLRHRLDAGNRRERGRAVRHLPRRPGRLRPAQPAQGRRRPGQRAPGPEIVPVEIPQRKGPAKVVEHDEHPRGDTTLEQLARSARHSARAAASPPAMPPGSTTAPAPCCWPAATLPAAWPESARPGRGMAVAGVEPRLMGIGPVPATRKVLELTGLSLADMDVIELNEAFAAQGLAVLRELGLADDDRGSTPTAAPSPSAIRWA